jgi:cephalosporin hydroxylase
MMRYIIDTEEQTISFDQKKINLYSDEAFELISQQWLKVGWNQKYSYTFTWMGRPIIQIPEDMIRLQEAIYQVKPDVILETGIAHGGSLIYSASLCKSIGKGRVIGVDIEIRPHNLEAIQSHELFSYITMIEGSSVAPEVVEKVKSLIKPAETALIILDSSHTKEHVFRELEAYHSLVSKGSYLVVTDGFMKELNDVPRGKTEWKNDNPYEAAQDFLKVHPEFKLESPSWLFNESNLKRNITHWPGAWLKRL